MCIPIFDLLPLILNSGTVDGEMWSLVTLMPVLMKSGPTHYWTLYEQFRDFESQWEKVSRRSIVGRGHTGHNLGSYEGFTQYVPSHMRPFLFECHISLCYIFAVKEVRGHHDLWTHLKMCIQIFDLLPFLLNNETVDGKMRS